MRGSFHKQIKKQSFLSQMQMFDLLPGPEMGDGLASLYPYLWPDAEFAYYVDILRVPVFHMDASGFASLPGSAVTTHICRVLKTEWLCPSQIHMLESLNPWYNAFGDGASKEVNKAKWGHKGEALTCIRISVLRRREKRVPMAQGMCILKYKLVILYHGKNRLELACIPCSRTQGSGSHLTF